MSDIFMAISTVQIEAAGPGSDATAPMNPKPYIFITQLPPSQTVSHVPDPGRDEAPQWRTPCRGIW